jgi:hypothetical protein
VHKNQYFFRRCPLLHNPTNWHGVWWAALPEIIDVRLWIPFPRSQNSLSHKTHSWHLDFYRRCESGYGTEHSFLRWLVCGKTYPWVCLLGQNSRMWSCSLPQEWGNIWNYLTLKMPSFLREYQVSYSSWQKANHSTLLLWYGPFLEFK